MLSAPFTKPLGSRLLLDDRLQAMVDPSSSTSPPRTSYNPPAPRFAGSITSVDLLTGPCRPSSSPLFPVTTTGLYPSSVVVRTSKIEQTVRSIIVDADGIRSIALASLDTPGEVLEEKKELDDEAELVLGKVAGVGRQQFQFRLSQATARQIEIERGFVVLVGSGHGPFSTIYEVSFEGEETAALRHSGGAAADRGERGRQY
ncbi:hypothetical protein TeGR_g4729 [Tetraparma gracilis]|uniref:Uncharacterized protein n=1 Tax=Tetraparma gracilis TaxID=2962635 RepID=A0ABQ6MYG3_9STRA|nr:hypothetical protein TeGR_g4729 [Tetraparma gracilis]